MPAHDYTFRSLLRALSTGSLTLALWAGAGTPDARAQQPEAPICATGSELTLWFPRAATDILMIDPAQYIGGHVVDLGYGGDITLSFRFESEDTFIWVTDFDPESGMSATWPIGPNIFGAEMLTLELEHEYTLELEQIPSYDNPVSWSWFLPANPMTFPTPDNGLTKAQAILKPKAECPS